MSAVFFIPFLQFGFQYLQNMFQNLQKSIEAVSKVWFFGE